MLTVDESTDSVVNIRTYGFTTTVLLMSIRNKPQLTSELLYFQIDLIGLVKTAFRDCTSYLIQK